MKKYLVTIEFRYQDRPDNDGFGESNTKKITIGVYDTDDEAIENGNKALEKFEKHFKLNPHYNVKERFSKHGGCFGGSNFLISDSAWIETPFTLFANITVLDYQDVDKTINEVLEARERYEDYMEENI